MLFCSVATLHNVNSAVEFGLQAVL